MLNLEVADISDVVLERYHYDLELTDATDVLLKRKHYELELTDVTDVVALVGFGPGRQ